MARRRRRLCASWASKLVVIGIGAWIAIRLLGTHDCAHYAAGRAPRRWQWPHLASQNTGVRGAATGIGIIAFLASLEILPLLGVDLKPLLASAGVAGVALGLAAQTIVKDILNGILLVAEDQFSVGDVVTLAGITGTVEELSLRKTTIRGFDGTLFVVPNSQITNTANMSRDYSQTTLISPSTSLRHRTRLWRNAERNCDGCEERPRPTKMCFSPIRRFRAWTASRDRK